MRCEICLERFGHDKVVTCGCGYKLHVECAQDYLLHTEKDAHCMKCDKGWDLEFQYVNLGRAFVNGSFRKHRARILLDKEKTKLPQSQQIIEREKELERMEKAIKRKRQDEDDAYQAYLDKQSEVHRMIYERNQLEQSKRTKTVFNGRRCPKEGCSGFLSSGYKCPLCDTRVCSKCLTIKPIKKKEEKDTHECIKEDVESAEMIKKETRGCPKCHTRIYKIEGCSQIWCTLCHTAFSWDTGKVVTGTIHNPHFFEWARKNSGGSRVRNPGEVVCGGLPEYHLLFSVVDGFKCLTQITDIYRGAGHIRDTLLDYLRRKVQREDDNDDIRVKFLKKEIDETSLASLAIRRDTARQKALAMLHVVELYMTVVIENLNMIVSGDDGAHDEVETEKRVDTIEQARIFCNKQFCRIACNFKAKAYYINTDYITDKMMTYKELASAS